MRRFLGDMKGFPFFRAMQILTRTLAPNAAATMPPYAEWLVFDRGKPKFFNGNFALKFNK